MSAPDLTVLGIETSCDETAAAVVRGGRDVLSNVVFSQIDHHRPHGGVVPEIASRCHVEALPGIVEQAVREAGVAWTDIDAVAATRGPGLASALLVGWSAAKGLARRLDCPLCAVNHIEAHVHSVFLDPAAPDPHDALPLVALVVSGGHTSLFRSDAYGSYALLGRTIDDAAGEALDKAAKLLGLGYPGGPEIDRLSHGVPLSERALFPAGRVRPTSAVLGSLDPELCFSFSGLKTSLRQRLLTTPASGMQEVAQLAAEYQEAVVEALVSRCGKALAAGVRSLAVGGGVSLNSRLRTRLRTLCEERGVRLLLALPQHCGDNAAMVAGLAGMRRGIWGAPAFALDVTPTWPMEG
jgi:N6-L-threonylcarbamoyladenine synthase